MENEHSQNFWLSLLLEDLDAKPTDYNLIFQDIVLCVLHEFEYNPHFQLPLLLTMISLDVSDVPFWGPAWASFFEFGNKIIDSGDLSRISLMVLYAIIFFQAMNYVADYSVNIYEYQSRSDADLPI